MKLLYFFAVCLLLTGCSLSKDNETQINSTSIKDDYYPISITNYASDRKKFRRFLRKNLSVL